MNKVILIGNLTKDPELTTSTNGFEIARFALAIPRKFKNELGEYDVDFLNVYAFRTLGANCAKYLNKGSKCCVIGRVQTRSYEDKEGKKRYITEIIADEVEFLSAKKENEDLPY